MRCRVKVMRRFDRIQNILGGYIGQSQYNWSKHGQNPESWSFHRKWYERALNSGELKCSAAQWPAEQERKLCSRVNGNVPSAYLHGLW